MMENKKIDSKLKELDKITNDLKLIVESEVEKYEMLTRGNKIEHLKRVILNNLNFHMSYKEDEVFFSISGFENYNESILFNVKGFKRERYSSEIKYMINVKDFESKFNKSKIKEDVIEFIETVYNKDLTAHSENVQTNDNNKKTLEGVLDLIKELGFSSTYLGYKTNRHKRKERLNYNFTSELRAQVPFYGGEDSLIIAKERLVKKVDEVLNSMEKVLKEKYINWKKENEKSLISNPEYIYDVYTIIKPLQEEHNLFKNIDEVPTLDKIKNYLVKGDLLEAGYNLEYNRYFMGDTGKASASLRTLKVYKKAMKVENPMYEKLEKLIHSIEEAINNYNGDGRIFRDMEYNYNTIYEIASFKSDSNIGPYISKLVELEYKYRSK